MIDLRDQVRYTGKKGLHFAQARLNGKRAVWAFGSVSCASRVCSCDLNSELPEGGDASTSFPTLFSASTINWKVGANQKIFIEYLFL